MKLTENVENSSVFVFAHYFACMLNSSKIR